MVHKEVQKNGVTLLSVTRKEEQSKSQVVMVATMRATMRSFFCIHPWTLKGVTRL